MKPPLVFLAAILTTVSVSAAAYEVDTHVVLTRAAATLSDLGQGSTLKRLGLLRPLESQQADQLYVDSKFGKHSVLDLISNGSIWEDEFPPGPIYHFFDPRTNLPLTLNSNDYPIYSYLDVALINSTTRTSPDWAIFGNGSWVSPTGNQFSWIKAREYLFMGMTNPDPVARSASIGLLFESIGRLVHHIQDMAQPQHVRNDNHLSHETVDSSCSNVAVAPYPISLYALTFCASYRAIRRPSTYEEWTNRDIVRVALPTSGYQPVYPGAATTPDGLSVFNSPRLFWANEGKGIAEYTNRNFFSAGTLDLTPPQPLAPFDINVMTLCAGADPPCADFPSPWPADEFVTFFPTLIDDQFRQNAGPFVHPFAKSVSIFDPEFQSYTTERLTTVNRFTFAKDHELLMPRAVGYSAGLINYFFRGDMEISLPSEGIFAIADTALNGCGSPCGFGTFKLRLRNATPYDEMGAGKVRAVVKYHLNNCYRPDLAGEYGGSRFSGNNCRSSEEYIAVSLPLDVKDGDVNRTDPKALEFNFPAGSFVPVNATDIYLQVVFRGQLGQEADAVAVTSLDIAEPNYLAMVNNTDYIFDNTPGRNYYYSTNTKIPIQNIQLSFAGSSKPVATIASLTGGDHAQVAILGMPGPGTFTLRYDSLYLPFIDQPYDMQEFTLDDGPPGLYSRSCPVHEVRKEYRQISILYIQYPHQILSTGGMKAATGAGSEQTMADVHVVAPKAAAGDYCYIPPDPVYDTSSLTAQTPATATQWAIDF